MRHETLLIDLSDPGLNECLVLKQGDTTRLEFLLTRGGYLFKADDCAVLLCATRPDGMAVLQADNISRQSGCISILLDPRILALPGTVRAELQFSRNGEVISSYCFTMSIQASAIQDEIIAPEEESNFSNLILAISEVLKAVPSTDAIPGNLPVIIEGGRLTDSGLPVSALDTYQTKEADNGGYFTADTVEGMLLEIGSILSGLDAALAALL